MYCIYIYCIYIYCIYIYIYIVYIYSIHILCFKFLHLLNNCKYVNIYIYIIREYTNDLLVIYLYICNIKHM